MRTYINRMLLCLVMFFGIGTAEAIADNLFVITDGNGNYLANSSGTLSNATSFDAATCVWTGTSTTGGTLKNNGYYLIYSNRKLTLSTTSSSSTTWTVSGNSVSCKSGQSTYYIICSSGSWSVSASTTTTSAYCYATTLTTTEESKLMEVKYKTGRKSGGEGVFERVGDTRNYYVELSYTPAYNTYSWTTADSETETYYASSDNSYTSETAPEAITSASSYQWESDYPANVTFDDAESDNVEATYETKFDTDTEVTITATATIEKSVSSFLTEDVTLTATDKVTLKSRYLTELQLDVKDSNDKNVSSLYIGETAQINYAGWYDESATVSFSSSDTSIATVSEDGVITAKGTGASGGDEAEVAIIVSTAQTDKYEAGSATVRITVKKHTTTLSLEYDKASLTYGEAAPQITSVVLTDTCDKTKVEGASFIFSSNDNCIGVDATTGALTINYAGTATITATYQGDDTHAKATATFAITVNKAATTLAFPQDSYLAQLNHLDKFTSPTATLSPEGAGSVTYSYTSETASLISIDSETGAITFNGEGLTGTATVTATFAGNNRYEGSSAQYVLTVSSKEMPELSLTISSNTFFVGETTTVTVSTNSTKGYTVASGDASVFTIDNSGKLTAVGEGSAVLNVTSLEDDTYMEVTASYPIEVKRRPTTITLTYPHDHYYTDHEGGIVPTVTVNATGTEELPDISGLISYSANDNSALTVDASTGRVTMLGTAGTAEITATYAGNSKFAPSAASFVITIKLAITPGTFVRLKDASGNYLSVSESDGQKTVGATSATADESNIIWYGTDRSLLFYGCGLYLNDATPQLGSAVDVGTSGTHFSFSHTEDNYHISDGTNTLTSAGDANWTMEVVDCLPLQFNSAGYGYATLYSPVDLSCPAGVVAYYPTARAASESGASGDYVITLKSVTGGYIPHGTPVVLYTSYPSVTYDFYIVNENISAPSDLWTGLVGSVATINTASAYSGTQWPYALQPLKSAQAVGFYPWKSDYHAAIPGFRCYIPGSEASNAKGFRFAFDDGTSAIDDIHIDGSNAHAETPIYNLQGIRVDSDYNSLKKGVYVRDGKKEIRK